MGRGKAALVSDSVYAHLEPISYTDLHVALLLGFCHVDRCFTKIKARIYGICKRLTDYVRQCLLVVDSDLVNDLFSPDRTGIVLVQERNDGFPGSNGFPESYLREDDSLQVC